MSAAQPGNGWQPLWERIMEFMLAATPPGRVVTYEEFQALGVDPHKQNSAVQKAKAEMLLRHRRTMLNVRGVGYRVVAGGDQLALGYGYTHSAQRDLERASDRFVHIDRTALTPEQQAMADGMADLTRATSAMLARQGRTEAQVQHVDEQVEALRDDVVLLRQQLAQLGIELPTPQVVEGEVLDDPVEE